MGTEYESQGIPRMKTASGRKMTPDVGTQSTGERWTPFTGFGLDETTFCTLFTHFCGRNPMRQPSSGLARGNGARDPRQNLKSYERNTPPHLGLAGGLGGWVVGGWWVGWLGWLVGLAGLVGWLVAGWLAG